MKSDDEIQVITVRMTVEEHKRALTCSKLQGVSLNRFCRQSINKAVSDIRWAGEGKEPDART